MGYFWFSSLLDAENRTVKWPMILLFLGFFKSRWIPFESIERYTEVEESLLKLPTEASCGAEHYKFFKSSLNRFMNNKHTFEDITKLIANGYDFLIHWCYVQQCKNLEVTQQVREALDTYIKKFINWELMIRNTNFLRFEKQKERFKKLIDEQKCLELYWDSFVIYYSLGAYSSGAQGFLFFHTLYALEYLWYICVHSIDRKSYDAGSIDFASTITITDKLREEIDWEYQKNHPDISFKSFSAEKGILSFAGKNVELAKKGNETDAVLLIKSIIWVPKWEYKYEDEILEEWDPTWIYAKKWAKNKVYDAARRVNELVLRETKIEDFLEHWTKKFRINPRYLKNW